MSSVPLGAFDHFAIILNSTLRGSESESLIGQSKRVAMYSNSLSVLNTDKSSTQL